MDPYHMDIAARLSTAVVVEGLLLLSPRQVLDAIFEQHWPIIEQHLEKSSQSIIAGAMYSMDDANDAWSRLMGVRSYNKVRMVMLQQEVELSVLVPEPEAVAAAVIKATLEDLVAKVIAQEKKEKKEAAAAAASVIAQEKKEKKEKKEAAAAACQFGNYRHHNPLSCNFC